MIIYVGCVLAFLQFKSSEVVKPHLPREIKDVADFYPGMS